MHVERTQFGDGLADVIIGAPQENYSEYSGLSYVIYGKTDQAGISLDVAPAQTLTNNNAMVDNAAGTGTLVKSGSGTLRRYLGSVSSEVVARSPCSVTVVRVDRRGIGDDGA